MRKSVRVATIFLGTAAVTAGFGPAVRATQASHITATNNCDTANKNWAEVSIRNGIFGSRYCSAFGFRGGMRASVLTFGSVNHVGQCGGNNYGGFPWTGNGAEGFLTFGPGTTFRDITAFGSRIANAGNEIVISGWAGGDKCP